MRKRFHAEPPYLCGARARAPSDISRPGGDRPAGPPGAVAPAAGGHARCTQVAAAPASSLATSRPEPPARALAAIRGDGQAGSTARRVHSADPAGPERRRPLLADGFARLSARSRQLRFLTPKKELSPAELR